MALIQNKLMAKAIRKEYAQKALLTALGITDPNQTLVGANAKQVEIPNWVLPTDNVEDLGVVGALTPEELNQTSITLDINQYGKAYRVKDSQIVFGVDGKDAPTIAKDYLAETIARFVDKKMLEAVYTSTKTENAGGTAALSGDLVFDAMFEHFGENAKARAKAFVVHSAILRQLKNSADYEGIEKGLVHANHVGNLFGFLPVIVSDQVAFDNVSGIYKNAIVKTNSLAYVLAKDVNVEQERDTLARATDYSVDTFFGLKAVDESVIIEAKRV